MSDVINLSDRRKPVVYTVTISHNWDDTFSVYVSDVADDPRSQEAVGNALYRASELFGVNCDEKAALRAENASLRDALVAHENHMNAGQTLSVKYLVPAEDPARIEAPEYINRMLEHFDGPEQRRVQSLARAALESSPQ